jgi:hypothetical protein
MGALRFNHVGLSVPADLLDEQGRKDILAFYGEVFGWNEHAILTEDRTRLVMGVYRYDQFVFLIADDEPMTAPRLDHFGLGVETMEELDGFLANAKAYAEKDARVDVIDKKVEDYGAIKLTSFYVKFLLPLMVEVQHYELVPQGSPGSPA